MYLIGRRPHNTHYKLLNADAIGLGADGTVLLVSNLSNNRTMAAKRFGARPKSLPEAKYIDNIKLEYSIGAYLNLVPNPNIMEVADVAQDNLSWYQIMEYYPYSLKDRIYNGFYNDSEIDCIFKQVLLGLAHMHSLGIAHRDLKLDNLMIDNEGNVRIIDFGLSAEFEEPLSKNIHLAHGMLCFNFCKMKSLIFSRTLGRHTVCST